MKAKKYIGVVLLVAMIALSGCTSDSENYVNFESELIAAAEEELSQDTILLLWNGIDSLDVQVSNESVSASARVGRAESIPEVAEAISPIIIRIAGEKGYDIGYIDYSWYEESIDDGSLVNWNTHDGIVGTFLVESDNIIETGVDLAYIENYYGDIAGLEEAGLLYQGEWQSQESENRRLIGNGISINFVSDSSIGDKSFRHVTSFELGYDENDEIVVCGDTGNPSYEIFIENDVLYLTQISSGAVETYVKISDNTDVPEEKVEPSIGMTEDEVLASTWGAPTKRNKTTTSSHEREQWVYSDGYIYFTDGIVTSIQEN